jgi:hypothetical protein
MNFFLTNTLCEQQGHYQNRYGAGATPPFGLPLDAGRSRPVSVLVVTLLLAESVSKKAVHRGSFDPTAEHGAEHLSSFLARGG